MLLREGGQDFRTGYLIDHQIYFDDKIDIHHIFPKDYCQSQKIDMKRCDCIVKKTPLSARTNRMIGGKAPSEYLVKLQKEADILPDRMNEILFSHVINPDLLRKNLFGLFFDQRMNTLLWDYRGAMGKSAARRFRDGCPIRMLKLMMFAIRMIERFTGSLKKESNNCILYRII